MNTRKFSKAQELDVANKLNGRVQPNSGATHFQKGDVKTKNALIECKTTITPKQSFSIKKEWLIKNKREAMQMGKKYSILAFNFGPKHEMYYVLDEMTFLELFENLSQDFYE